MDMSVKLNLSYPAAAAQGSAGKNAAQSALQASPDLKADAAKEPPRAELDKAVKEIQDFVNSAKRQLDFSVDDSTGKVVVKVIATDSGEVVRQIPSEAALKLAQSLSDAGSLLFEGRV
ncbi:flagellar protein FlaG [Pseudomonas sp. LS1212]|uniref:flagellar protein FlaG n=1 Tax=Pseudomonas sp. LS1212 TaxID=2972478 RepID=UPI00215C0999|nr:flagellar protein FlaG [Pseudomonas sp. LS1212]UVJ45427.1 flagellar protein FlaG [Pseudomonas sp. LS1212]